MSRTAPALQALRLPTLSGPLSPAANAFQNEFAAHRRTLALLQQTEKAFDRAQPLLEACLREVPDDQPARVYLERCLAFRKDGQHEGTGELGTELVWRDEFMVGEATIDGQHQELLDHMNRLSQQVTQGDRTGLDEIMAFIGNDVHFHFETEEAMMRKAHYPLMAAHVREHRSFVERYLHLAADIAVQRSDPLYLGFQIQLFLFDWFANHSTRTDRHLGRFMESRHLSGLRTPMEKS